VAVVGRDAAGAQQVGDGLFEGRRVEGAVARNADASWGRCDRVVVTAGVVRGQAHGFILGGAVSHPDRDDTPPAFRR